MRIPDACRYTGISRSTLYEFIAKGQVEIIKLGSSTLVITDSLEADRRPAAAFDRRGAPGMSMHPELARAIITACLDQVPQSLRRDLASKDEAKRKKAEDAIAAMIVVAFAKGGGRQASSRRTALSADAHRPARGEMLSAIAENGQIAPFPRRRN